MEIIGRRWTIAYALAGSLPGLLLMLMAHWAGDYATVVMVDRGADHRLYLAPGLHRGARLPVRNSSRAPRGRGHIFGELVSRLFAGVLTRPF